MQNYVFLRTEIKNREDFEVIDGENLSFLAIDEVYSLQELIGV